MSSELSEIFVAEIPAFVPNDGTVQTFYFTDGVGFSTTPSDTPANTHVAPLLKQTAVMSRTMFGHATTRGRSTIGYGDLVLENADGELDEFFKYGFDAQTVTIRRGPIGGAYPADFTTDLVATMGGRPEVLDHTLVFKLRDRQAELDKPLQTSKYAGDNTNGQGLEGGTELTGKPKPFLIGKGTGLAPVLVNAPKLIYQVHDGEVASVDMVYDRGLELTVGLKTWTSRQAGNFENVRYANGIFVAVGGTDGATSFIYTSPDGETWTSRTSSFGTNEVNDVAYGNGVWVAVGHGGKIATSHDNGETWTQRTPASFVSTDLIKSVAFGRGVFVISGNASAPPPDTPRIETSPDGITWTARAHPFSDDPIGSCAYGNGVFVVAGAVGQVCSSADGGATWTGPHATSTAIFGSTQLQAMEFGRDRFIAAAGAVVATSLDGVSWTQANVSGFGSSSIFAGTYGLGYYILGGTNSKVAVSRDALGWILQITTFSGSILGVATGNGSIVISGTSGLYQCRVITTYATESAIQDDAQAPEAGSFGYYAAGGLIRLGAQPEGLVTCDATEGDAESDRTTAQVFKRLLERAGFSSSDYSSSDLTTLDAAADYVIGYWTASETQYSAVLDEVTNSVGASWFVDKAGDFRIKQLLAPTGTGSATITANAMLGPPKIVQSNDPGKGLPTYETIIRYGRNYSPMSADVAPGVESDRRSELMQEWFEAKDRYDSVLDEHPLAVQSIEETLLTDSDDAEAEAARRQGLHLPRRDFLEITAYYNEDTADIDLHDEIEVVHERYGLNRVSSEDGPTFRVLGIEPNARAREITFTLWGTADLPANIIDGSDDAYFVDDDGAYFVMEAA